MLSKENTGNLAFEANVQSLLRLNATGTTSFDENVLVEINIDTDGDAVEDFLVQAIPRVGIMYLFGSVAPANTGINSTISVRASVLDQVAITFYDSNATVVKSNSVITLFVRPRRDPFFMNFAKCREILAGVSAGCRVLG
jgi:hypothetical protein